MATACSSNICVDVEKQLLSSECNSEKEFSVQSDSDYDSTDKNSMPLSDSIKEWVQLLPDVKHNAGDDLLKCLKINGHPELPATVRTLLQACRTVEIDCKSGMEYVYLGIKKSLLKILCHVEEEDQLNNLFDLEIALNIDGLSLFKSTKACLWPILYAILNVNSVPLVFPIALAYGKTKPDNLQFLHEAVEELRCLLENGLEYNAKIISIILNLLFVS